MSFVSKNHSVLAHLPGHRLRPARDAGVCVPLHYFLSTAADDPRTQHDRNRARADAGDRCRAVRCTVRIAGAGGVATSGFRRSGELLSAGERGAPEHRRQLHRNHGFHRPAASQYAQAIRGSAAANAAFRQSAAGVRARSTGDLRFLRRPRYRAIRDNAGSAGAARWQSRLLPGRGHFRRSACGYSAPAEHSA